MKKGLISTGLIIGLASSLYAGFSVNKDIQVVSTAAPTQTVQRAEFNTKKGELFNFVTAATPKVKVGEAIKVALKLKEKAYIYMIAVSERNNKAYLILPNRFEGYNLYRPNTHYVVPERSADYKFISDRAGTETIYVIASTYKQKSFKELLNKFGSKEVAGFRTTTAVKAKSYVKDILVVAANTHKKKVEVRKIEIQVTDKNEPILSNNNDVQVFLSSGRSNYQLGDTVTTMYQSNRNGYVTLFIKNPNNSLDLLTSKSVKANSSYKIQMKAEGKSGKHTVVAYYSKNRPSNPASIAKDSSNAKGVISKDLRIVSQSSKSSAVNEHTVMIRK